jgi:hypothetical protein
LVRNDFGMGQTMKQDELKSVIKEETDEPYPVTEEERMTARDWARVFVYFVLGLFLLFVFFYMIFAGPKAALIASVSLLLGIVLWVIFRYVLKEIA